MGLIGVLGDGGSDIATNIVTDNIEAAAPLNVNASTPLISALTPTLTTSPSPS